jgi:hypothetical protein
MKVQFIQKLTKKYPEEHIIHCAISLSSRSCMMCKDFSRLENCFSRRAATLSFPLMDSFVLAMCSFILETDNKNHKRFSYT